MRDTSSASDPRHPIVVGATRAVQSSRQVWRHLLCADCEQRLSARGEHWVLGNCYRGPGQFNLQAALHALTPAMGPKNGLAMYACATEPTVRVDSLTYFAASTFWRAGAISWHDKDRTEDRIALGPYQELLRQFLLDEASFPAHCTLWIFVSNAASPHLAAAFPFGNRVLDFRAWRFWVPGIQFILLVGQQVPAAIRVGCAVYAPDRYVMLTDDFESDLVDVMRKKIATVTPTRGLG